MRKIHLYLFRLLLVLTIIQFPDIAFSQENLALKTWNSQNASNIQMLKLGKEVLLLPQTVKFKDLGGETIKKSIYVGDYIIHLLTNNAVIGIKTNYREQYQILIGQAQDIYTVDANNLGFDFDDNNYGYALTVENGSARPIIPNGTQVISSHEVRTFYNPKDKSRHYDISKYIGDMRDLYKNLRKGAFAKAYRNRQDIIKRANKAAYGIEADFYNPHNPFIQALYPIWQLADALLNCRPLENNEISARPDYLSALSEVGDVIKKNQLISEANQFLQMDNAFTSVDEIRSIVEKALLELSFKENTEEAYDRLLANISDVGYIKQATIAREKVAFNSVSTSKELSECERYLAKYKNVDETHYTSIKNLQYELAYNKLDNTTEACKQYLEDYPDSYYTSMVRERLYKCAYLDLAPTAAACQEYIDEFPESPYIEDVRNNLYKYAFRDLGESIEEYESYLEKYPHSPYYEQVNHNLEELSYYDAIEKEDLEVYAQFLEKYPFSIYTDDINQRRRKLMDDINRYAAEYPDDDENYEVVWDYSDDNYDYVGDDTDEKASNNKSSSSGKRSKSPASKKRTSKAVKKSSKKTTTQQPAKPASKDASKKANSLIFGPNN